MIRKCNTSHSKQAYTPYHAIRVTEFLQNEQQYYERSLSTDDFANEQLNLNILKIKQCKKQTEEFLSEMNRKIISQNQAIYSLESRSRAERQQSKNIRMKYHEALINLRRKEEQNQRLQRCLQECRERYEFVMSSSSITANDWIQREEKYKKKIIELEQVIHQQAEATICPQHQMEMRMNGMQETGLEMLAKQEESTFL